MFAPQLNVDLEKLKESEEQGDKPRRVAAKGRASARTAKAAPPKKS